MELHDPQLFFLNINQFIFNFNTLLFEPFDIFLSGLAICIKSQPTRNEITLLKSFSEPFSISGIFYGFHGGSNCIFPFY